jgi:hypothetical protein
MAGNSKANFLKAKISAIRNDLGHVFSVSCIDFSFFIFPRLEFKESIKSKKPRRRGLAEKISRKRGYR